MKDEILIRHGGGPFTGVTESYKWNGQKWLYRFSSHDSAPLCMAPGANTDTTDFERPLSSVEEYDLLQRCGLTEEGELLVNVSIMPPEILEKMVTEKQRHNMRCYEVVSANRYTDVWVYTREKNVIPVANIISSGYAVTKGQISSVNIIRFLVAFYGQSHLAGIGEERAICVEIGVKLREFKKNPAWHGEVSTYFAVDHGTISESDVKVLEKYVRLKIMTDNF